MKLKVRHINTCDNTLTLEARKKNCSVKSKSLYLLDAKHQNPYYSHVKTSVGGWAPIKSWCRVKTLAVRASKPTLVCCLTSLFPDCTFGGNALCFFFPPFLHHLRQMPVSVRDWFGPRICLQNIPVGVHWLELGWNKQPSESQTTHFCFWLSQPFVSTCCVCTFQLNSDGIMRSTYGTDS